MIIPADRNRSMGYDARSIGMHVNEAIFMVEIEDRVTGELITEPASPAR